LFSLPDSQKLSFLFIRHCLVFSHRQRDLTNYKNDNYNRKTNNMKQYAIRRHDGAIFPERYETLAQAEDELVFKLGNAAGWGLAWVVEIIK
jgi:hypothetical protein